MNIREATENDFVNIWLKKPAKGYIDVLVMNKWLQNGK
jgi:hypothetical protein